MVTDTHRDELLNPACTHAHRLICRIGTHREDSDFLRKKSELLIVEVILKIDVNWSQCL